MIDPSLFERPTHAQLVWPGREDEACLRFEDEWNAGRRPKLEEHLATTPEQERGQLLQELLLVEWWRTNGRTRDPMGKDVQKVEGIVFGVQAKEVR